MAFAIAMFFSNLLVPAVMILAGYMMYKYPPTSINGVIGYRTKRSKMNMDTWKFAHHYCGKLWLKIGVLVLLLTILVQIPFFKASEDIVAKAALIIAMVQVVIILCSIWPVERALKKNFDENGNRKEVDSVYKTFSGFASGRLKSPGHDPFADRENSRHDY